MASPSLPDVLRERTGPEQWIALPRELLARLSTFRSLAELKVVLYVLWHTYGYREYASMKAITLDEFEHGRKRKDGSRMDEGTGLSRAAIKLGLKQAKEDAFLYEVVDEHDQARIVRWYAVQLPSDGSVGGLESTPLTQPYDSQEAANSSVGGLESTPLAQPYDAQAPANSSASGIDASPQSDRFQPPEGQMLAPGGIDSSPRTEKETLERNHKKKALETEADVDTRAETDEIDALAQRLADQQILQSLLAERQSLQTLQPGQVGWGAAQRRLRALAPEIARLEALAVPSATGAEGSDASAVQDLDALQQRQVAKHALQKLLAEQEQLRALLPSQRGWGAAQGRLRALAREIEYLQDQAALPTTAARPPEPAAAAGEAEPSEAPRSPAQQPMQRSTSPAVPEPDTRWQRLMQLQSELAHLKKTPSMQLLARQRIPRLEAEIKRLIAEMQQSA